MAGGVRYLPSGDCALTVEFGRGVDRHLNMQVMALEAALQARNLDGVIETVPTFRSLTVHYDPSVIDHARLCHEVDALDFAASQDAACGRIVTLPVAYGGVHGPDLGDVAAAGGLNEEEAIARHSAVAHYVYMIGFAPGHPYMGDLPAELTLPRRMTPRTRIAPGTVAVAVGQTVIYPFASPGGWHAIGRTPVDLFNIARDVPALLRAGDSVRLRPVTADEYDDLQARPLTEQITIAEPAR
ncbi:allophanate hydrolase subunit 1 [Pelagivirga sediminicola]|uniref:Allophanate hydrolase subunit 1 n=1 Tax=Pelagivirga sediminicola TaxID=2170575 RepID=A0A2T7G7E9_9RHOB|nr:5-oxoprolinase subunit PxpB [Pelagivirga sediminicola]PVA10343.1 allophanate hydrolase subunit 1 [Pelagivirga sediminicola]